MAPRGLPLVPRGTPIAVVAPCGIFNPERFEAGLSVLRRHGHDPRPLPGILQPWRYLAGDDDHRASQLLEALTSPEYGAVWIARGGYGLTRIVDRLPLVELPRRPVVGFSDVTALFSALHHAGRGPLLHAPVVHSLPGSDEPSIAALMDALEGAPGELRGDVWVDGEAEGRLAGGNLCLFAALCGTRFQLDTAGAILILEDVAEPPYRIDRMLRQCVMAGMFEGVRAVVLGEFKDCDPKPEDGYALRDVLLDHLAPLGVPVLGGVSVGHGARNHAFPWGVRARVAVGALTWEPASR